ncbi:hypothetical protein G4B88_019416 [Cannabis sativa]|uniref:Brix domain-containing protein n=1 Tax=Cannabis sativa TaxID=3483 RepID=A0A7J6HY53_CANSA|nr:hypothetical protein G4B88_019416 [Cannabis sativa]
MATHVSSSSIGPTSSSNVGARASHLQVAFQSTMGTKKSQSESQYSTSSPIACSSNPNQIHHQSQSLHMPISAPPPIAKPKSSILNSRVSYYISHPTDEDPQICLIHGPPNIRRNIIIKDFLNVAGPMCVTHFLILSKTPSAPYLRVARTPQGPILTFKIKEYSLDVDVVKSQLRPRCPHDLFTNLPLILGDLTHTFHVHIV